MIFSKNTNDLFLFLLSSIDVILLIAKYVTLFLISPLKAE